MILIAYASKTGTAKEAAGKLAVLLPVAELVDLAKVTPNLDNYDSVIIGSGIRMGSLHRDAKAFIDANRDLLIEKRLAFFITNGFSDSTEEIFDKCLPKELREQALWVGSVGGKMDLETLTGFDKVIAKMVSRAVDEGKPINTTLDDDSIARLSSCFR